MWEIIRQLNKSGVTVFLTTQYLEEAEELADRVSILDAGQIIAEGTTEELKSYLPQGAVQFLFKSRDDFERARACICDFQISFMAEEHKLILFTDGNTDILTEVFYRFHENNISIREFLQKNTSLEEVFLSMVARGEMKSEAARQTGE